MFTRVVFGQYRVHSCATEQSYNAFSRDNYYKDFIKMRYTAQYESGNRGGKYKRFRFTRAMGAHDPYYTVTWH